MAGARRLASLVAIASIGALLGCASDPVSPEEQLTRDSTASAPVESATTSMPTEQSASAEAEPEEEEPEAEEQEEPALAVSDGRPRRATVTIPAIGVRDQVVVPYRGWTDDAPGTDIQNRGLAASPSGPRGGVGPGGVGNYQVTGHRLSSTRAFEFLPDLTRGARVFVETPAASGPVRYVYRIVRTRETSFRSAQSLREQRAAVPGRPGVDPTRAMITLSTCSTVEDHAAGNYWADEFDNPEHRIDKIGVLVAVRPS